MSPFPVRKIRLGEDDVGVLSPLVAPTHQDYQRRTVFRVVDAVASTHIDAKFRNTFTNRTGVAEISG